MKPIKNLGIKLPVLHILAIVVWGIIVKLVIETNAQAQDEVLEVIYGISFFVAHEMYFIIFAVLLIIPLPFLVFSIFKKRKDLIIGFSLSTLTSIILILVIFF